MKLGQRQTKIALILAAAALIFAVYSYWPGWRMQDFGMQNRETNGAAKPAATAQVVVTKVIDGDTVVVSGGEHVRLLGIDADEPDYPCYKAAKTRLEELVLGKTVTLEADNENTDQYGRLLRHIFLDGKNINGQLVSEGLAIARFYPENQKYKAEIVAAEAGAMRDKTGCKWQVK